MSKEERKYKEYYLFIHQNLVKTIDDLRECGLILKEIYHYALSKALTEKPLEEVAKEILEFRIKNKELLKEVP